MISCRDTIYECKTQTLVYEVASFVTSASTTANITDKSSSSLLNEIITAVVIGFAITLAIGLLIYAYWKRLIRSFSHAEAEHSVEMVNHKRGTSIQFTHSPMAGYEPPSNSFSIVSKSDLHDDGPHESNGADLPSLSKSIMTAASEFFPRSGRASKYSKVTIESSHGDL